MSAAPLAVLWDVDGTLADSEPMHHRAMCEALAGYGIKAGPEDDMLGGTQQKLYATLAKKYPGMPAAERFLQDADDWFCANIASLEPMRESVAMFRRYRSEGRRQAAVSNGEDRPVRATLAQLGLLEELDALVVMDGEGAPKPAPDPYARALRLLGIGPEQAIAVEDSAPGAAAAKAAGLFVVGLPADGAPIGADVHFDAMPNLTPEEIVAGSKA
ncbi:MAG: HAD family phosphatase [Betaproteobacteria bacterium AqS2]|uniref:HAD family phosphatase n=1 Tax=Candidatus Amphirhobacter heronislandensis TaxID=1732024 RepID=A0A930UBG5_9GAMM|nr:HAD family phosphatase [Betaproteobacteria bacterium AqS2]